LNIVRTVRLLDGRTLTANVKVGDLIAFERHFDMDVPIASGRVEHWAFLTWTALNRQGDVTMSFDEFIDQIDEFENEDEAAPKDTPSDEESVEP
jgi:hypothetical protein